MIFVETDLQYVFLCYSLLPCSLSGSQFNRAQSTDVVPVESHIPAVGVVSSSAATTPGSVDEFSNSSGIVSSSSGNKLVHQLSTTSTSTSSNESSAAVVGGTVPGGSAVDPLGRAIAETPPSTDSSIVDDEVKKRKRKLHFPFGRRSKNKGTPPSGTAQLG